MSLVNSCKNPKVHRAQTAAERMRLFRRRRKFGRQVVKVEVDPGEFDALIDQGYLGAKDSLNFLPLAPLHLLIGLRGSGRLMTMVSAENAEFNQNTAKKHANEHTKCSIGQMVTASSARTQSYTFPTSHYADLDSVRRGATLFSQRTAGSRPRLTDCFQGSGRRK
jgi:hypothetical protein